jgi:hypothetical protein
VKEIVLIDEHSLPILEVFKSQGEFAGLGVEFGLYFFAELPRGDLLAMDGKNRKEQEGADEKELHVG